MMNQQGGDERVNLAHTFICFDLRFYLNFLKKRKGTHLISDPINYFFLQVMGSICANATAVSLFSIIIVKILDNPLL